MPIYEYKCLNCGHVKELIFSPRIIMQCIAFDFPCEKCGSFEWQKIPSVSNFVIK